jgi:hypothetical protein
MIHRAGQRTLLTQLTKIVAAELPAVGQKLVVEPATLSPLCASMLSLDLLECLPVVART